MAFFISSAQTNVRVIAESRTIVEIIRFFSNIDLNCFFGPDKNKDLKGIMEMLLTHQD
jgi:hypothetical protein